jgi:putrescine aminotransferase
LATPALLHPFARPAREHFVEIVSAAGARVRDAEGREYLDAIASLWYCAVGHGRSEIADAVAAQIRTLDAYNTFELFTNGPAERLADRVRGLSPLGDGRVFLCSSGSEAVDTAIKLARAVARLREEPDRQIVVRRARGYHGTAVGGTSAQGLPRNRAGWGDLLPHVEEIDADDI